jgi:signal transduction histidine kinase
VLGTSCQPAVDTQHTVLTTLKTNFTSQRYKNSDSMLVLVRQADSLADRYQQPAFTFFSNFAKGVFSHNASNYRQALAFYQNAAASFEAGFRDDSLKAGLQIAMSDSYNNLSDYESAVKHALAAKKIFETNNNAEGMARAKFSLARIHQTKGDLAKAKKLLNEISYASNENTRLLSLHTLANVYGEEGMIDSALAIDNAIIAQYKSGGKVVLLSPFYNNKALCLSETELFDSALFYFKQSLELDSLNGNIKNMAANYDDMGSMYMRRKEYAIAKQYFQKGLAINQKVGKKQSELTSYRNLLSVYRETKDYETALRYSDTVKQLQKSVDNLALNTRIAEMDLVYETNKKEEQIEAQQQTIEKKNALMVVVALGMGLLSLLVFQYQKRQKLKQQLLLQEEKYNKEKEKTAAILQAEETERQRISRDLHDNMGAYTSALLANVEEAKTAQGETALNQKMQANAESILSNLRETIWVLNNKEVDTQTMSDTFKNYCFGVLRNFEQIDFVANENLVRNEKMPASVQVNLQKILQEIVQNTIKHGKATKIEYKISDEPQLTIELKDNGVGFDVATAKNGNGLENIEWRASQIGFVAQCQTAKGQGTSYRIRQLGA